MGKKTSVLELRGPLIPFSVDPHNYSITLHPKDSDAEAFFKFAEEQNAEVVDYRDHSALISALEKHLEFHRNGMKEQKLN